jgi:anti-sigma-K factor RskA
MTLEEMQAEIARLRQAQANQRTFWRRWGLASAGIAVVVVLAILARVAMTGADPAAPMLFIVLTFVFLSIAFSSAGRSSELS